MNTLYGRLPHNAKQLTTALLLLAALGFGLRRPRSRLERLSR
ncbi:hypothetical protein [Archangium lansingense]|uniref:Uncharacterized protein n=1 Tax=Archangium lansingense TaxID=2995310 RepID=A0ABT3ZXP1_9BACT|nr:hypothetical protein [Archangium lansinium]MCY1074081.1 hypothetical protein [Archangium lansinium]